MCFVCWIGSDKPYSCLFNVSIANDHNTWLLAPKLNMKHIHTHTRGRRSSLFGCCGCLFLVLLSSLISFSGVSWSEHYRMYSNVLWAIWRSCRWVTKRKMWIFSAGRYSFGVVFAHNIHCFCFIQHTHTHCLSPHIFTYNIQIGWMDIRKNEGELHQIHTGKKTTLIIAY